MEAIRLLSSLTLVVALVTIATASPTLKPRTREVWPDTRDEELRGGALIDKTRDGEMPMALHKPKAAGGASSEESREEGLEIRTPEFHEPRQPRRPEGTKPRRPDFGNSDKKSVHTDFSRFLKDFFRRGGADIKPRTHLKSHIKPETKRDITNEATARGDHRLPVGKHTLNSDNFPTNYTVNKISTWNLRPETGTASMTISCPDFKLEGPSALYGCVWDYLYINGIRFCGADGPKSITANWLQVKFKSDTTVVDKGFSCQVEVHDGCCGRSGSGNRIVGGTEVTPAHALPWQVGLINPKYGTDFVFCGGSVLNSRYIITAAHCTDGFKPVNITVAVGLHDVGGTAGARIIKVQNIIQHSQYNSPVNLDKDISLLRLAEEITFSDTVRPVCLPRGDDQFENVPAIVSGWGTLSSGGKQPDALHCVTVQTVTNAQCGAAYGNASITSNMLCAAESGKDSCQGDSGGPLVSMKDGRATQIGVVSFGKGCADPGYPGVYVRVSALIAWIDLNSMDGQVC